MKHKWETRYSRAFFGKGSCARWGGGAVRPLATTRPVGTNLPSPAAWKAVLPFDPSDGTPSKRVFPHRHMAKRWVEMMFALREYEREQLRKATK